MNIFKSIIVSGLVAATLLVSGNSAVNATSNKCTVEATALGKWGSTFTVKGSKVTSKFTVKGTNCTTPVTLAVWEMPTATGINDQKLFTSVTKTFAPGEHTLTANLPNCRYQADLVLGSRATAADGTANYQYQNGQFVDGGLRDFIQRGSGVCVEKPQTPVTPVSTTPVTPAPVTPVVTSLPSTGAGSIVAATVGLSTTAGLAYNLIASRKKLS